MTKKLKSIIKEEASNKHWQDNELSENKEMPSSMSCFKDLSTSLTSNRSTILSFSLSFPHKLFSPWSRIRLYHAKCKVGSFSPRSGNFLTFRNRSFSILRWRCIHCKKMLSSRDREQVWKKQRNKKKKKSIHYSYSVSLFSTTAVIIVLSLRREGVSSWVLSWDLETCPLFLLVVDRGKSVPDSGSPVTIVLLSAVFLLLGEKRVSTSSSSQD
jgi:hypothetical protein